MNYKRNDWTHDNAKHYKLEPGDGTMYRFALLDFPYNPNDGYILASGVGNEPFEYVKLLIDMPGGTGCATLLKSSMREPDTGLFGYAQSHGLGNVHSFTLAAVLLACSVLVNYPDAVEDAAAAMLGAVDLLRKCAS